jgi:dipeptidyl aminopeptidase/acylaminoacyl peptidase
MRSYRWLLALLALIFGVLSTPLFAASNPNNIVEVYPPFYGEEEPAPLLTDAEIEKISQLQTGERFFLPWSEVSPDDEAVLVLADEDLGFLNIQDGSLNIFSVDDFGPLLPLPLLSITNYSFNWLDERTLGALALNFLANSAADAFVVVLIDRYTLELQAFPIAFPEDAVIAGISPDFTRYLLAEVTVPQEDVIGSYQLPITYPAPAGGVWAGQTRLPQAWQQRIDQARATQGHLLNRLMPVLQDGMDDENIPLSQQTLDLQTYDITTGEIRYVTTIPFAAALLDRAAWTNDSAVAAISFVNLTDIDALPRGTFDGALISDEIYRDTTGNLAPSENPWIQGNRTYVIDFNSGTTEILFPDAAYGAPMLSAADWSTDNQTLMVKAWYPAQLEGRTYPIYTPQFTEKVTYRFYDRNLDLLNELDLPMFSSGLFSRPIGAFVSPDEVIFRGVIGSDRHPIYYNRVSGEVRNIADRAGSYWNVFATNQSQQIVYAHASYTSPFDIYRSNWDGTGVARLTWVNEELRQLANLRQDPVSFTLANGETRVGVLIQPADATFPPEDQPMVVWQQGGPGVAMLNEWLTRVEDPYALLPAFDIPLLITPVAGRPGYSPQVFNSLVDLDNFGAIDIDEQAEIVRQAIAAGWTSEGKVGITGCSYGGYFTWQSIVRHPDLYAAANPQCALVDAITEWTRGYDALMPYIQGLPPYRSLDEYRADSPSYNADEIKAAVLSFHGTFDFLPITLNENLHLQLVNNGVDARMIKFIDEGHGLFEEANQLYAAQEQITWFREHLK